LRLTSNRVIARNRENGNEIYFSDIGRLNEFISMLEGPLSYIGDISTIMYLEKYFDAGKITANNSSWGRAGAKLGLVATGMDIIQFLNDPNWDTGTDMVFTVIGNIGLQGTVIGFVLSKGKIGVVTAAELLTETSTKIQRKMVHDWTNSVLGVNPEDLGIRFPF
jgi:hypothetical protein